MKPKIKEVRRYTPDFDNGGAVVMPMGAKILSVQYQDGYLRIWALVSPDNFVEQRCFKVCSTNEPIDMTDVEYVATVHDKNIVWHVFDYVI